MYTTSISFSPSWHKKIYFLEFSKIWSLSEIAILENPGAVSRVGRKGGTKVFKYGQKSPWVPTLTRLFPKIQADAASWLGAKNALYYCGQSANSFSWVLFVSSYTKAIFSPHLPGSFIKLVRARKSLIFYFPNQKRRDYRWVARTFGMLSAEAIQFAPRILCFWRITMYRKFKMRRRRESQIGNSFTRQNNNFARATRFFVHIFAVDCTTTRENA